MTQLDHSGGAISLGGGVVLRTKLAYQLFGNPTATWVAKEKT